MRAQTFAFILLLMAAAIVPATAANDTTLPDSAIVLEETSYAGVPVLPESQATVTVDEMRSLGEPKAVESDIPPFLPTPENLPLPESAHGIEEFQAPPSGPDPQPLSPPLSGSFAALADNGTTIPPDTMGAVGPNHLMVTLNSQVGFQTKSGSLISAVGLGTFWSSLGVTDTFDPKVIYDPHSDRFIFVTCAQRQSAASSMLLGVSATSDPTGAWHMWQLDGDASDVNWVDYPNIGITTDYITFTANMYTNSGNSFAGANIWVVDKSTALDGGAVTSTLFFQTGIGGTWAPALTYDAGEPTQYLVATWGTSASNGYLRVATVTGPASAPIFTVTGSYPSGSTWDWTFPDAPQNGTANLIETNDPRMMNAVVRNGSLWCTHTVALPYGAPNRTAAQWWEIALPSCTTTQSGVIDGNATGTFYYFPSIAVNANDEVLIGFSGSSSSTYASAYYATRDSTVAPGTTDAVQLLKAGENTYYKTFGGSRNRWGDYSATMVDPSDDVTLWTIQEYAGATADTWATWWGRLGDVMDHFEWSPITSPQAVGVPFPVTVTAKRFSGTTDTGFTGTVELSATVAGDSVTIGSGTATLNQPLGTYYHDSRTQVIYLQSELGGAKPIEALALDVTTLPGQDLGNWTIRMKHTSLSEYTSGTWEGPATGWTTVYQQTTSVSSTGWVWFAFTTPFAYNGTDNLLVDFSHNNASYTTDGYVHCTSGAANRTLYYRTDSGFGDPLDWTGTTPTPTSSASVPNVKLNLPQSYSISPTTTGAFTNGVWSGNVTVNEAVSQVVVTAEDTGGHVGSSNAFDVNSSGVTHTLTYLAGPNGSIVGTTPQIVADGASGTPVTADPNTGYAFVQWSDASTDNPRTDTNVTSDITVTASFAADTTPPSVPIITGPNGGVDYATSDNAAVTLTGTCAADAEQILINGNGAGVSHTPGRTTWSYISGTLAVGANVFNVTAVDAGDNVSAPATLTITYNPAIETDILVSGNLWSEVGDSISFTALPAGASGYAWYKNSVPLAGETYQTMTIDPIDFSDAGVYYCEVTTVAKTVATTPSVELVVFAPGALPVGGAFAAGVLAAVLAMLATVRVWRRRYTP